MPSEQLKPDPRLMCERCGEFGRVVENPNGTFCVHRYDAGRLCCCTLAYADREKAIAKWESMWRDDA
jgi:hypothetical protein